MQIRQPSTLGRTLRSHASAVALLWLPFCLLFQSACSSEDAAEEPTQFRLTLENISSATSYPTPFAPGVFVLHAQGESPLYQLGEAASEGLTRLAESGDHQILLENLAPSFDARSFVASEDGYEVGAARPGASFTVEFSATSDERLSLAFMFAESNDTFFATPSAGLSLFSEAGEPRPGSLEILILDAGTEVNEEFGKGPNQAPRQDAPEDGVDENGVVALSELSPEDYVVATLSVVNPK